MDRLFTLLVTLIVAAGLMYGWDRHPPIEFTIPIPIIHPKIRIPPGPVFAAQARAQAAEKANATCQASFADFAGALKAQKTAVDGLQAQSAAIVRQIAQSAQAAKKAQAASILRANDILALQLGGLDACADYELVDAQVRRGIEMINMLLLMIAAHFLFDYAGQGDFMARAKNPSTPIKGVPWQWALIGHAWIHGALVGLITGSTILGAAEFVAHASTDYLKTRGELTFSQDQTIHIACKVLWMVCAWALMRAGIVW